MAQSRNSILLYLDVQAAGALEFLLAAELADAPVAVLTEVEESEATAVVAAGCVALCVKHAGVL